MSCVEQNPPYRFLQTLAPETALCLTFRVICKSGLPQGLDKSNKYAQSSHLRVKVSSLIPLTFRFCHSNGPLSIFAQFQCYSCESQIESECTVY